MRNRISFLLSISLLSMILSSCAVSNNVESNSIETNENITIDESSENINILESSQQILIEEQNYVLKNKTINEIMASLGETDGMINTAGISEEWLNWDQTWEKLNYDFGLTHTDYDLTSAEVYANLKENAKIDLADISMDYAKKAASEELLQPYVTSYDQYLPEWAKDTEGYWSVGYAGATSFLTNSRYIDVAPKSWKDVKNGSFKVAIGDIESPSAQAAIISSCYAFGGDLNNLEPAFDFWRGLASMRRINTNELTVRNFDRARVTFAVMWSYANLPIKHDISKYDMYATIPEDGALLQPYALVVPESAENPYAAALAKEYILSEQGQEALAKAGAIPLRTDLVLPQSVQDESFSMESYAQGIPITDMQAYKNACARIVKWWQEEIEPEI